MPAIALPGQSCTIRSRYVPQPHAPEYSSAMHRIRSAAFPAMLCLVLAATGCSSPVQTGGANGAPSVTGATRLPSLTGTEWNCIELIGRDGTSVSVTDRQPTISITADGKVSGFAGVNRFFTEATFGNTTTAVTPVKFGPVGATRMAGPPERMQLEGAFTSMLERVRSAQVVAGRGAAARPTLVLSDGERMLARFTPAPEEAPASP